MSSNNKEFTPEQWVDLVTAIRQVMAKAGASGLSGQGGTGSLWARAFFMAASELSHWPRTTFFHEVARQLGAFVADECNPDNISLGDTPGRGEFGAAFVKGAEAAAGKRQPSTLAEDIARRVTGNQYATGSDVLACMAASNMTPRALSELVGCAIHWGRGDQWSPEAMRSLAAGLRAGADDLIRMAMPSQEEGEEDSDEAEGEECGGCGRCELCAE